MTHIPVLSESVLSGLNIQKNGYYLDATYGRGGHSRLILEQLGEDGRLWVVDRDPEAIEHAKLTLQDSRVTICHDSFANLDKILNTKITQQLDGVLFDLGVSSTQIDEKNRGFSFRYDGVLDMRFDQHKGLPIHVWLNQVKYEELADVIHFYGEEPLARAIARAIIYRREQHPILNTAMLANIVAAVVRKRFGDSKIHPATRTFQALRMYANDELGHIEKAFLIAGDCLKPQGRLVIMTFHGLETRMVKSLYRNEPLLQGGVKSSTEYKWISREKADVWEIRDNPRSRSAQTIILEKIV